MRHGAALLWALRGVSSAASALFQWLISQCQCLSEIATGALSNGYNWSTQSTVHFLIFAKAISKKMLKASQEPV